MASVTVPAPTIEIEGVAPDVYARTAYHPSVDDVAAVLRARTEDSNGNQVGTFNADTRPTAAQVRVLIDGAVAEIKMRIGDTVPTRLHAAAKQAAVLHTAASIERSYVPEQAANRDMSVYQLFRDDYTRLMEHLVESVADPTPGSHGIISIPLTTTLVSQDPFYPYEDLLA